MSANQKVFNVAALQMVSAADLQANLKQAGLLIQQAAEQGTEIVVLPEYFCFLGHRDRDKLELREQPGAGPIQQFLSEQASKHKLWVFGGTLPLDTGEPNRIFNALLVFDPSGRQVARYDKIHLFGFQKGDESYDESVSIKPGPRKSVTVNTPLGRVGLSICYDLRFPELYRSMGDPSLIVVPSAFTYTTGQAHWELLLRARAVENQCYVVAPAQGGHHQNGRRTWGHSMLVDPWGRVLAMRAEGPGVVCTQLSTETLAEVRAALPALKHRVL